MQKILFPLAIMVSLIQNTVAQNGQQITKITANERFDRDRFGFSKSLDGDYAFISPSLDDEDANGSNTLLNGYSAYFYNITGGEPYDAFGACAAIEMAIESTHNSNIGPGIKNSLIAKLQTAKSSFQNGNTNAAINKLNAFINEVQAQSGKKIPSDLANSWIEFVLNIIEQIESGEAVCSEEGNDLRSGNAHSKMEGEASSNFLNAYPNPATHILNISTFLADPSVLYLTDVFGKIIFQKEIPAGLNSIEISDFEKNGLSPGYYFMSTVSSSQSIQNKILITK